MTAFKLLEVEHDHEFEELFRVFRTAFTEPGTAMWPLFTADYRPDAALEEAALKETIERFISWHRSDPTSHWLKVIDEESGSVLGGGRWALYKTGNPYDGHGEMEASWWPDGEPRQLATTLLNQFLATSAKHMNKPHAFLNILFTHPEYRRQGVGSLIMNWGLERADELGLDTFIEATKEGKPCYESFGFKVVDENSFRSKAGDQSGEWKEIESKLLPFTWWSMIKHGKA
ncbi:hypothetical protein LTR50_005674 [Elasticomyces elasticus]|nr:hypothetical protein LTR50_005674 [Elasticomyces elasticus]